MVIIGGISKAQSIEDSYLINLPAFGGLSAMK